MKILSPGRTNGCETFGCLARLLADDTLRVPIQATYELEQAPAALSALPTTHTQGKLAIRVQ